MNIVCLQADVLDNPALGTGKVRATFLLGGLLMLTATLRVDEAKGVAEVCMPLAVVGEGASDLLTFPSPFARTAFAALLAKAVAEFAANRSAITDAQERLLKVERALMGLADTVDANTRALLGKVGVGGVN